MVASFIIGLTSSFSKKRECQGYWKASHQPRWNDHLKQSKAKQKAPKHGWAVVTIHDDIHAKIREMIQNPRWDEPGTISAFVENAVIKEIKRVGKQRRKLWKEEGEETLGK